jgi:hypothetical protein
MIADAWRVIPAAFWGSDVKLRQEYLLDRLDVVQLAGPGNSLAHAVAQRYHPPRERVMFVILRWGWQPERFQPLTLIVGA